MANTNEYNVTVAQLRGVMELKNEEALVEIDKQFGSLSELVTRLKSHMQNGIAGDEADVARRQKLYGKNEIPPKPPKTIFRLAFEALQDPTLMLLIACAVISIGLSFYHAPADAQDEDVRLPVSEQSNLEWVEGVAIAIAVCVVVGVSSFNDWRKERQFRGLQDRIAKDNMATLVRGDKLVQVNIKDIVVGDICCIKYGDLVPADGIVTDASDLKIDESSLTGETDLIKKNTTKNVTILSGTHVMEGTGRYLVTAVGLNSQTGIIMRLLGAAKEEKEDDDDEEDKKKKKAEEKKTNKVNQNPGPNDQQASSSRPGTAGSTTGGAKSKKVEIKPPKKNKKHKSVLQMKLAKLSMIIGYIGMTAAILTFLILLLRFLIDELAIKKKPWSNSNIKYILSYFIQGITVIVVAVPEGLPLAVTLALAFAVQKMTKDNNLVRHIDACETMGNATAICSDKTGTLTTNRMTAVQCWIGGVLHEKIPPKTQVNEKILTLIYESISVNSNYSSLIEQPKQANELPKQLGNKTECGLLGLVLELGGSYEQVRQRYPIEQLAKVYTFNSARKMMSTAIRTEDYVGGGGFRLHSKGASEMVLSKCTSYLDADGNPVPMSPEKCDEIIKNVVEKMAMNGLRTICVAYRDFPSAAEALAWEEDEASIIAELTCICLVGIEDPVRPEVPDAIKKCQTSGVVVRMVTGDNVNTATSIAMKCGIIKPGDDFLILESKEFNSRIKDENGEVKQELLDQVWPKLRVLARSSPQDKYILVNGVVESKLNPDREVVAVTGDGTNDGPALKRADVGFAMGIQGTDVAKEASDIILTDDNFSSIVKAMMWGRNVYDSIAKFLQFQLTVNFIAGIFALLCSALIQAVPLKAVQMLWVNLVMDTLASLALATEPPTEALLQRKPYGRTKPMVSIEMMKMIILQGCFQLVVLFVLIYEIEDWMAVENVVNYGTPAKLQEPSVHFTIIFNAFVVMTLFNEVNCRMINGDRNVFSGIWNNWIFIVIWIICFCGQILIVNVGGVVMSVKPIPWDAWMWSLFLGGFVMIWHQFILMVPSWPLEKLSNALAYLCCCCCRKKEPELVKGNAAGDEKIEQVAAIEKKEKISREFSSKEYWMSSVHKVQLQLQVARHLVGLEKKI